MRFLLLALVLLGGNACAYPPPYNAAKDVSLRLEKKVLGGTMVCSGWMFDHHAIATDEHCIEDGTDGFVMNGRVAKVLKVVKDGNDHVLLETDLYWEHVATLGPKPRQGDAVFTQGNPDGERDILLLGHVAGFRDAAYWPGWGLFHNVMLVDSNDTHGCSGAAVFDSRGRVVGQVSALYPVPNDGWKLTASFGWMFTKEQLDDVRRDSALMSAAPGLLDGVADP
jgi:S1-C subfamily serine protease